MKIKKLILISILVKILIIPFFFHPDILWIYNSAKNLSHNKIFNIYEYETKNNEILFKYPPLAYYFFGIYTFVTKPFITDNWTSVWTNWLDSRFIFRQLFLMKIPYLIFDYFILFLLLKICKSKEILYYWALNPVVIYFLYVYGQFDIIPVFFILLSFYLVYKEKKFVGLLSLSLAISFKIFPLILLPFFIIFISPKIRSFIKYSIIGLSIFIISILPFLHSNEFIKNVFSNSENYIFQDGLIFNNSFKIALLYLLLYFFIFFILIYFKQIRASIKNLNTIIVIIFIFYFLIYNFNPQFCLWIIPFLIIEQFERKIHPLYFILVMAYFVNNLFNFGRNTFSIHLAAIDKILYGLPSPAAVIEHFIGFNTYLIISNSILSAAVLFYLFICVLNLRNVLISQAFD